MATYKTCHLGEKKSIFMAIRTSFSSNKISEWMLSKGL